MENIANRVVEIEDYNGNTLMAFEIDEKGNIIKMQNCNVADIDGDYIFNTNKELVRLQVEEQ